MLSKQNEYRDSIESPYAEVITPDGPALSESADGMPDRQDGQAPEFCLNLLGDVLWSASNPLAEQSMGLGKPFELLKMLVALDARPGLSAERVATLLWPDADGDFARTNFDTTIHRLRKRLGRERTVDLRNGLVFLDATACQSDVWALKAMLSRIRCERADDERLVSACLSLIDLYRGDLLEQSDAPWVVPVRERLKREVLGELERAARYLAEMGDVDRVVRISEKMLVIDPFSERTYRNYIQVLAGFGLFSDAVRVYQRCRQMLASTLGLTTSPALEAIRSEVQKLIGAFELPDSNTAGKTTAAVAQ